MRPLFRNTITLTLISFSLFLLSCNNSNSSSTEVGEELITEEVSKEQTVENEIINTLVIEGKDIWVRSEPTTGEVVMKLNTGDKCEILTKGKFEIIKEMQDYWYQISFDGNEGWVYGSQTSVKLNSEKLMTLQIKTDQIQTHKKPQDLDSLALLKKGEIFEIEEIGYWGLNFSNEFWYKTKKNEQEIWIPGYQSSLMPLSELSSQSLGALKNLVHEFTKAKGAKKFGITESKTEIIITDEYKISDKAGVVYEDKDLLIVTYTINMEGMGDEVNSQVLLKQGGDLIPLLVSDKEENNYLSGYFAGFIDIDNDGKDEILQINHFGHSSGFSCEFAVYKINKAEKSLKKVTVLESCIWVELPEPSPHCNSVKLNVMKSENENPLFILRMDDANVGKEVVRKYKWASDKQEMIELKENVSILKLPNEEIILSFKTEKGKTLNIVIDKETLLSGKNN